MNSPSNPQHEPTMEEILASIRKIISEDQVEPPKQAAYAAAPEPAPPPAEPDVLDLTEEIKEPAPAEPVLADNDIVFESIEERPKEPAMDDDELISASTRQAVDRAVDSLHSGISQPPMAAAGGASLETVFTRAVHDAFEPTLHQWVDGHATEIMASLKPLIRAWMDEHLPPLIEGAVQKEISRAVAAQRKR